MNVLKLFISTTWGKKGDQVSLARFQETLLQKGVTRDAKNFYTLDNCFQTIVTGFALTVYMQDISSSEIPEFKTWLSENNWPKMIENVKDKYLGQFKIIQLWASITEQVKDEIITNIACEKQEWLDKRAADYVVKITTSYKK